MIKITNLDRQVIVPASDVEPRNMGADLMVLRPMAAGCSDTHVGSVAPMTMTAVRSVR